MSNRSTAFTCIIGLCIVVIFAVIAVGPINRGTNGDPIHNAQAETGELLYSYGEMILDYRRTHAGASPQRISDLLSSEDIDFQKTLNHPVNRYVEDTIFSFGLPDNKTSNVLVFEKPGHWSDGTVGVCYSDLTIKRMTLAEFEALGLERNDLNNEATNAGVVLPSQSENGTGTSKNAK